MQAAAGAAPINKYEIIEGCEGEGCGAQQSNVAREDFILHKTMDRKSKIVGRFKAGAQADDIKSWTLVLDPGSAVITQIKTSRENGPLGADAPQGLKAGMLLTHIFYDGEGFMHAKFKGQRFEFWDDQILFKQVRMPRYQVWYEIKVGEIKGYTLRFPFELHME